MYKGRFSPRLLVISALLNLIVAGTVHAWFFGGDDKGKSGLDFNQGYDMNSVTTMTGRVVSPPHAGDAGHVVIVIQSGTDMVHLVVGPTQFWKKNGIPVSFNDNITVKGARAQGDDGRLYLLAQKINNLSTGKRTSVRDDLGMPAWSAGYSDSRRMEQGGSMVPQGGGMRGSMGGMGGRMMRR
jgi:hypothetical protein